MSRILAESKDKTDLFTVLYSLKSNTPVLGNYNDYSRIYRSDHCLYDVIHVEETERSYIIESNTHSITILPIKNVEAIKIIPNLSGEFKGGKQDNWDRMIIGE